MYNMKSTVFTWVKYTGNTVSIFIIDILTAVESNIFNLLIS